MGARVDACGKRLACTVATLTCGFQRDIGIDTRRKARSLAFKAIFEAPPTAPTRIRLPINRPNPKWTKNPKARFWRAVGISRMSSILEMVGRGLPKSNSIRLIVMGYGELGFMGCPQSCPREYIHQGNTRSAAQASHLLSSQPAIAQKKWATPASTGTLPSWGNFARRAGTGELRAIPYSGCGLAKRTDQVSDPSHGSRLKGQGPLPTCKPPGAPRSCVAAGGL